MILYSVIIQRLLRCGIPLIVVIIRGIRNRIVGRHYGRHVLAAGHCRLQHLSKTALTIIKLVISESGGIIPHHPHESQLRGIRGIEHLEQGTHGKVAAVHSQGVGMKFPLLLKKCGHPGKASALAAVLGWDRLQM